MCNLYRLKLIGAVISALFLLGLFAFPAFGTDSPEQIKQELNKLFNSIEAKLTEQTQQINSLEKNLQEQTQAYNDLKQFTDQKQQELNFLKEKIKNSEALQQELETRIQTLENLLNDVRNLLKSYEKEIRWLKIQRVIYFIGGLALGYAAK